MFNAMPVASVMSFMLFAIVMLITIANQIIGDKWVSYD